MTLDHPSFFMGAYVGGKGGVARGIPSNLDFLGLTEDQILMRGNL